MEMNGYQLFSIVLSFIAIGSAIQLIKGLLSKIITIVLIISIGLFAYNQLDNTAKKAVNDMRTNIEQSINK